MEASLEGCEYIVLKDVLFMRSQGKENTKKKNED